MKRWALVLLIPLVWLALAYAALRYVTAIISRPTEAWTLARQADEAANVAVQGQPNTTVSARAARAQARGRRWGCVLCWVLDHVDPGHCARAIQ